MRKSVLIAACVAALAGSAAQAHTESFQAILLGSNEITGGDPDGHADALVTIDYDTNTVGWNISYSGLSNVTAAHIHNAAFGANGPIAIGFPGASSASGSGTLTGSVVTPNASLITAFTAADFYVNLHSSEFTKGAIRGQLAPVPEPESYALMLAGLAALGCVARRKRRA